MKRLIALALALVPAALSASDIPIRFFGLTEELEKNVRAHLAGRKGNPAYTPRRRLMTSVREGIKPFGYYRPKVKVRVLKSDDGTVTGVNVAVDPGKRLRLTEPHLDLQGPITRESGYVSALEQIPPVGSPLIHDDYESFKNSIQTLALELGYFESAFSRHSLKVSPSEGTGYWDIAFNSGPRYRFGKVNFEGSQIAEEYLQGLVPFKEGQPYEHTAFGGLSSNLNATNWFGLVVISPQFDKAKLNPERVLDIDAHVTPRKQNMIETGVGYATDIGPHGKLSWTRPWINSKGHSLTAATDISPDEQSFEFNYRIPSKSNPLSDYWTLQSGYKRSTLNDTDSSSTAVSAARLHLTPAGWTRSISVDWLYDSFTQGSDSSDSQLIYPTISFSRTRLKGGIMPTWGDTQRYSLSISNTAWGSDIDFMRLTAQQSWVRSIGRSHIFVGRWSAGWVESGVFDQVPPDLRFFVGGDATLRGYDYESISPKNENGELEGGSKMFTVSLEYQYNFAGNWWTALFFDAGQSSHDFDFGDIKKGAGAGLRWRSPIGLFKLDVARAVNDAQEDGWKLYFGLGGAL